MKRLLLRPVNWLARQHPGFIILPFFTSLALAAMPTTVGVISAIVAAALFLRCSARCASLLRGAA